MADDPQGAPDPAGLEPVLDALPDGVLIDRDGFVVYANPSALRTLGHRRVQELFFRRTEELVHPSERDDVRARLAAPDRKSFELRLIRRTGEVVPIEARLLQVAFEGSAARMILFRDLSERRRLEKQLQFADRMASVGTLAAGVAHEINNPLTYILGNLDMMTDLLSEAGDGDPAEIRELVAETRDGALRVQSIVRDLKSFARESPEQRVSDVDLTQLVESVLRMAQNEIKHRARLVKELDDALRVRANANHLHQVLLNLVVNAAQAIEMGSYTDNEIRVTTGRDATGNALIEVADTGCGIPPAALERIYDPFYTTKDQGVGSGLGLWICHGLVTQLGGEITCDSIVGRGTSFRVSLPAAAGSSGSD